MTYTAAKPRCRDDEQLRARIPGWGVDLDPADRPSSPKLDLREDRTGAHWDFPDRQPEAFPRERSMEHKFLTPVFGTSCPPRGVSGVLRRLAYRKFSEADAAHWLILMAADRSTRSAAASPRCCAASRTTRHGVGHPRRVEGPADPRPLRSWTGRHQAPVDGPADRDGALGAARRTRLPGREGLAHPAQVGGTAAKQLVLPGHGQPPHPG
jgi:hypothetical protein